MTTDTGKWITNDYGIRVKLENVDGIDWPEDDEDGPVYSSPCAEPIEEGA